jgi:hypothetical protein
MSTRTLLLALFSLLAVASLACDAMPTPGLETPPAATPDIEATVQAAVRAAFPAPESSDAPDLGATVIVSVQATVEAMREDIPVPRAIAAPVATATAVPTSVPTPTAPATPTPAAMPAAVAAGAAAPAPTVAPVPTAEPARLPTRDSASAFVAAAIPTPAQAPAPKPTPVPVPTPTPPPLLPSGCQPAADGAVVTAWVEGVWAASTTVQDGNYVLFVDQIDGRSYVGQTVTFKIGGLDVNESGTWQAGGGDELDLTAAPWRAPSPTPAPSASPPVGRLHAGLLAQPVLPHVFLGGASICGSSTPAPTPIPLSPGGCRPAADGAVVTAWVEGVWAASATVRDGRYAIFVEPGGGESFAAKTVAFKIGGLNANESGIWEAGGADDLDLTTAPRRAPDPTPAPAALLPRRALSSGLLAQPVPPHVFLGKAAICG